MPEPGALPRQPDRTRARPPADDEDRPFWLSRWPFLEPRYPGPLPDDDD